MIKSGEKCTACSTGALDHCLQTFERLNIREGGAVLMGVMR